MTVETKVIKVGDSFAVILPKEIMAKLCIEQGDKMSLVKTAEGIMITSYDAQLSKQMELASKVMRENRKMLEKLAE